MTKNFKNRLAVGAVLSALVAVFAFPAIAAAQQIGPGPTGPSPSDDQYIPVQQITGGGETDPNDTPPPPTVQITNNSGEAGGLNSDVGPLPFTGFDVIAMIAVALAVTGLGLGLRYAVSRQPSGGLGS